MVARPSLMYDQRSARTSPRRAPVPPHTSRKIGIHQGPDAAWKTISCSAEVQRDAKCFFTRGGSLLVAGLVEVSLQRIARANALETTPAMFRTVFALIERGVFWRVWPRT
jgi:hypothetical protein